MLKMPFILRSLIRDWRSNELTLLAFSLIISMTCVTAINNFSSLIYQQLNSQSASLLGADQVLTSSFAIPDNWKNEADRLKLKQTVTLSFLSMVENNNQLQLAQIKSVKAGYPLYGQIKLASTLFGQSFDAQAPPKRGTIWVSPRLFPLLNLSVGDNLTLGKVTFKITQVLVEEPGQAGDWFNLSPRIMMNYADVEKTEIIQPGSNISYRWLLGGSEEKIQQLKQILQPILTEHQTWATPTTANKAAMHTLENTLVSINIGTIMSLLLAGVAISMASMRYMNRHQQHVAILRCFGLTQRSILLFYLASILGLGLAASLIGIFFGYLLQPLLIYWLGGLFLKIDHVYFIKPFFLSLFTGLSILLSFALPNLLILKKISVMQLFRPGINYKRSLSSYGYTFLFLTVLSYLYTYSWKLTLIVILGCGYYVLATFGLLVICLRLINTLKHYVPLHWRFGFTNIQRNLANSTLQILGIGLALTALLTLSLLKNNLLHDWKNQLPKNAPNFFIINIESDQVQAVTQFLNKNSLIRSHSYPMVRGRISTINNQDVTTVLGSKVQEINALQRELNFSWADSLPEDNKLIAGKWDIHSTEPWISIEEEVARKLGVGVGDTLGIRLGATFFNIKIANIRNVRWINLRPNFFIIFKPGIIDELPKTYIMSFYLPPKHQAVLADLIKQFPNITLIDVADTIKKIQSIFLSATKAITLISLFSLLAGITIAILVMLSFYDLKQQETWVLKILGMRKRPLLWVRGSESFILGFFAGLLASLSAFAINYYLNVYILMFSVKIPWLLFLSLPLVCAVSMLVLNYWLFLRQYELRSG